MCGFCVVFLSRSRRLVLPFVLCGLLRIHVRNFWLSMGSEGFQTQRRKFWDRSGPKRCWQMPSRLMSGRNGYVSSVPKPGGVVDDDTLTSQLACREITSRLSLRRTKDGTREHFLQVAGERDREREGERETFWYRGGAVRSLCFCLKLLLCID